MTVGRYLFFRGFCREFDSPELENQYWQQRWEHDRARARMFVIVVMVSALFFSISDYLFFGLSAAWGWLTLTRIILIAACLTTLPLLNRAVTQDQMQWSMMCWSLIVIFLGACIVSTRPNHYIGHILPAAIFVLIGYFMIPCSWVFPVIPGILITVGYTIYFWQTASPDQEIGTVAIAITFLALNLLGWFWSVQWEHWKRTIFMSLLREKEMRAQLEQALAEINSLRSIVPICSHCKHVRAKDGAWHQVEVFVSEHTHVDFSHGFCPDCLKEYYEKYLPTTQV